MTSNIPASCARVRPKGERTDTVTMTPREFFDRHVEPAYDAWLKDNLSEWKMQAAIAALNNMAAWSFDYWSSRDKAKLYSANNDRAYREMLARECPAFALVRDIADGHKHVSLDRKSRCVTKASQTTVEWYPDAFGSGSGEDAYDPFNAFAIGADWFVVTLDDGTKKAVHNVAHDVYSMWWTLVHRWGHSRPN